MQTSTAQIDPTSKISGTAAKRYRDAYRVAKFTNGLGGAIKILGLLIGIGLGLIIGGILEAAYRFRGPELLIIPVVMGGIVFFAFYIWGVLVSAQGQIPKATIDGAVHGSPFLDNEMKAKVMSLP